MAPSFAQYILHFFVFIKQMCWETITADVFSHLKLPSVRRLCFRDNWMSILSMVTVASSKPFWMVTPQKIFLQLYRDLSLLSLHLCQTIKALKRLRFWSTSLERRVWHHTTMVAKCLDLNSLCWWRRPSAFSNDARKVWATVLFLSAIIHRKVTNVNFFRFFFFCCHICRSSVC